MVVVGGAMGGDERTISLVHSTRLLLAVLTIPFGLRIFGGYQPTAAVAQDQAALLMTPGEGTVLALCGVLGYWIAKRARLPAPALTGPMILSAVAHVGGLTAAAPPDALVALAQVVIGAAVGCRFSGIAVREVLGALSAGMASTLIVLGLAVLIALALAEFTGLPFPALLLAFAPGGLAEMSLVSLALGIDAAFVSTHHLVRILFIVTLVPLAFRVLAGPLGVGDEMHK